MKKANHFGWMSVLSLIYFGTAGCSSGALGESIGEQQADLSVRRICGGPLNLSCAKNQFCNAVKPGLCPDSDQLGVCSSRPRVCTDIFDPVCGCDGATYPNACNAAAVGVAVASRGACPTNGQFCGGIAGIPCPDGQSCVDDPSDDCDPQNGGADCGGICIEKGTFCGGIAGIPCPDGQSCVDDPSDDCDPQNGGADCGGICTEKGTFCGGIAGIPCPDGQSCVDDPSDDCDPKKGGADCGGICVTQTDPCAAVRCRAGTTCVVTGGSAQCVPPTCGNTVCAPGLQCCNPLRSICTPPGVVCPL